MKVLNSEMIIMVDVDDTLLMWKDYTQPGDNKIAVTDPYDGVTVYLYPHTKHIDQIRKWKGRGYTVIVWSAGGVQWANAAIEALGLTDFVEMVMTKPSKFVDDLPANQILGTPVYLPYEEKN